MTWHYSSGSAEILEDLPDQCYQSKQSNPKLVIHEHGSTCLKHVAVGEKGIKNIILKFEIIPK